MPAAHRLGTRQVTNRNRSRSCVRPRRSLSGVTVTPPPGAFLQASASVRQPSSPQCWCVAGQRLASPNCSPVAAQSPSRWHDAARVSAWEGDAASASLARCANTRAAGRIDVNTTRSGASATASEGTGGFAAVVLDPPFAGAAAQAAQIAAAKVPVVIYVSCNPATLAAMRETAAPGRLSAKSATPIDQFLWSAGWKASGLRRCRNSQRLSQRTLDSAASCRAAGCGSSIPCCWIQIPHVQHHLAAHIRRSR